MISHSRIALALLMALIGAAALCGEDTPSPALLVLSKGDLSLAIVDPATLRVVGRVPSGPDPHEVIASADGKIAYISNYGGGAYNTITVADICEWIWQNTLTTPGLSNRSPRLFPLGKRPRSNVLVRDNENTL